MRESEISVTLKFLLFYLILLVWLLNLGLSLEMNEYLLILFLLLLLMVLFNPTDHDGTPLSNYFRFLIELRREHVLLLIQSVLVVRGLLIKLNLLIFGWQRVFWCFFRFLKWILRWFLARFYSIVFLFWTFVYFSSKRSQIYDYLFLVEDWFFLNWVAHELLKFFIHLNLELFQLWNLLNSTIILGVFLLSRVLLFFRRLRIFLILFKLVNFYSLILKLCVDLL